MVRHPFTARGGAWNVSHAEIKASPQGRDSYPRPPRTQGKAAAAMHDDEVFQNLPISVRLVTKRCELLYGPAPDGDGWGHDQILAAALQLEHEGIISRSGEAGVAMLADTARPSLSAPLRGPPLKGRGLEPRPHPRPPRLAQAKLNHRNLPTSPRPQSDYVARSPTTWHSIEPRRRATPRPRSSSGR